MIEWEKGEIKDEPLSIIAADDSLTCAAYTKNITCLLKKICSHLLLCRSVQLLFSSQSGIACLHVSFTTYEYFYKLSKSASFSQWLLHPVTQKNQ